MRIWEHLCRGCRNVFKSIDPVPPKSCARCTSRKGFATREQPRQWRCDGCQRCITAPLAAPGEHTWLCAVDDCKGHMREVTE